eukprot:TRINITY_DN6366_c0_g1_i1.p1 TRINITY_DN6366_c0_g1~~TRINITY_DN6366_c0_g1_i1.p1  ORF type:complete len:552 (+),score=143.68 TRINITY_DN6366_c0_g1_i1:111-1766(+)
MGNALGQQGSEQQEHGHSHSHGDSGHSHSHGHNDSGHSHSHAHNEEGHSHSHSHSEQEHSHSHGHSECDGDHHSEYPGDADLQGTLGKLANIFENWIDQPRPDETFNLLVKVANNPSNKSSQLPRSYEKLWDDAIVCAGIFEQFKDDMPRYVNQLKTQIRDKRELAPLAAALWQLHSTESLALLQGLLSGDPTESAPLRFNKDDKSTLDYRFGGDTLQECVQWMLSHDPIFKNLDDFEFKNIHAVDFMWTRYLSTGKKDVAFKIFSRVGEFLSEQRVQSIGKKPIYLMDKDFIGHIALISVNNAVQKKPKTFQLCEEYFATHQGEMTSQSEKGLHNIILGHHQAQPYVVPVDALFNIGKFSEDLFALKIRVTWQFVAEKPVAVKHADLEAARALYRTLIKKVEGDATFSSGKSLAKTLQASKVFIGGFNLGLDEAKTSDGQPKALKYLKIALQIAPEDAFVNRINGDFLVQIGEFEEGTSRLRDAVKAGDKQAMFNLGKILMISDEKEAVRVMEDFCKQFPDNSKAKVILKLMKDNPQVFLEKILGYGPTK